MEIYGKDFLLGKFRASDYDCYLASFSSNGEREEDTGIAYETIEEFVGDNPVPKYLGQKVTSKLHPTATLTKNSCTTTDLYFTEYECRAILKLVTGFRGYQWMKIETLDVGEDIWYKARVTNVSYNKINGKVVGIKLDMECDSMYAWSVEHTVRIDAKAGIPFSVYSKSEDPYSYVYPYVEIEMKTNGDLEVVAPDDNNWTVKLKDVRFGEIIRYDCANQIIDGSRNDSGEAISVLLNDSNVHFFRLKTDRNTFITNLNAIFTFKYRYPIKVAFVSI